MDELNKEKQIYVKNLKDKYTYQLMDEAELEKPKNEEKEENMITDVFSHDKIEVV